MKWKYEWPLWMFLDFPENNNNALAPAVLMPRGVGNTIITPTLHIPSLAFLCYMYYIQRDWKTSSGNCPYPCQLLLSNHISKYLVLYKKYFQTKRSWPRYCSLSHSSVTRKLTACLKSQWYYDKVITYHDFWSRYSIWLKTLVMCVMGTAHWAASHLFSVVSVHSRKQSSTSESRWGFSFPFYLLVLIFLTFPEY